MHVLGVRVDPELKAAVEKAAAADQRSVSQWIALKLGAAESVKRTHLLKAEAKTDWFADRAQSLEAIRDTLEFKTTWHPIGA